MVDGLLLMFNDVVWGRRPNESRVSDVKLGSRICHKKNDGNSFSNIVCLVGPVSVAVETDK